MSNLKSTCLVTLILYASCGGSLAGTIETASRSAASVNLIQDSATYSPPPLQQSSGKTLTFVWEDGALTAKSIEEYIKDNGCSDSLVPLVVHNGEAVKSFAEAAQLSAEPRNDEAAAATFMKAYGQDNSMSCAAYNAGILYERSKNYDKAIVCFKAICEHSRAIFLDWDMYHSAQTHLARIYFVNKGDRHEASQYVTPILQGATNGTIGPVRKKHRQ